MINSLYSENMEFFGKKGQGALEDIMTYGWMVIVVIAVGFVLWAWGILGENSNNPSNHSKGFMGTKIGVMAPSIKCTTSQLTVILNNQAGVALSSILVQTTSGTAYGNVTSGFGDGSAESMLFSGGRSMLVLPSNTVLSVSDTIVTGLNITFTERVGGRDIFREQSGGSITCTVES